MNSKNHDHKKCIELFEKLSEYIDCELDQSTCERIEDHLVQCPPCNVCYATLKRTIALCKEIEEQPVPENFSKKLKAIFETSHLKNQKHPMNQ